MLNKKDEIQKLKDILDGFERRFKQIEKPRNTSQLYEKDMLFCDIRKLKEQIKNKEKELLK